MAEPISIQQLKDASEDAITLADFIYKPANVMIPRRLAADINSLQYYLDYMSSYAQHSYETYNEMVANAVNLPSGVSAFVTNDLDTTKNGIYTYNGTSFVRGDYQPEKAAKDYVDAKLGGLQVFDGKVRAQDVSIADGSTQESKNTDFRNELDALPFEGGVLADTFVTVTAKDGVTTPRTLSSKLSESISPQDFGCVGDANRTPVSEWIPSRYDSLEAIQVDYPHVTELTDYAEWANFQNAINYAQLKRKPLVDSGGHTYAINKPLTSNGYLSLDMNYSKIEKTTNTVGVGSVRIEDRNTDYNMAVDAWMVIKDADGNPDTVYNVHLSNINFTSSAGTKHTYGVYAPMLAKSTFENILYQFGKVDYGFYGYIWWLIHKMSNLRQDGGICLLKIADDGSGFGGSTSINGNQLTTTEQATCIDLYAVSYSVFDMLINDNAKADGGAAYIFAQCQGITLNSPSTEHLRSGKFIQVINSYVVMNTPRAFNTSAGTADRKAILLDIGYSSYVIINMGLFFNYIGDVVLAQTLPLLIGTGSYVQLNMTSIPTNANNYRGDLSDSSLVMNDKLNGRVILEGSGAIDKVYGRRTLLLNSLPVTGTFQAREVVIINGSNYIGKPMEYTCVVGGASPTWRMTKQGGVERLATTSRPSGLTTAETGFKYFDTTVNKFVYWSGTTWLDAVGTAV